METRTPCPGLHTLHCRRQRKRRFLVSDEGAVIAALQPPPGLTLEEMREHQRRDKHLQDIRKWKNELPTETERQLLSPDQRKLLTFLPAFQQDATSELWGVVSQEDGAEVRRLYVPHALRHRVIEAAHQFLGHGGNHGNRPFL